MAKDDEPNATQLAGCVGATWALCLNIPIFCALMYGVVLTVNPPQWVWVIFWIYVPVAIIGGVFTVLIRILAGAKV